MACAEMESHGLQKGEDEMDGLVWHAESVTCKHGQGMNDAIESSGRIVVDHGTACKLLLGQITEQSFVEYCRYTCFASDGKLRWAVQFGSDSISVESMSP